MPLNENQEVRRLTVRDHIRAADKSLATADGMDDPLCASAEAQIAQAHLLAAVVKMAERFIGEGKRPAISTVGLSLLKMAK